MSITYPRGFRTAAATAGLKPSGKPDLCLIVMDEDAPLPSAAAVFTTNAVVGAPVLIGRDLRADYLSGAAEPRAILVNAGNSNAATGDQGILDARACMQAVGRAIHCSMEGVLPSSTGIIGRPLAVDKITAKVPDLAHRLAAGQDADEAAAAAIMTTDLVPKTAKRLVELPDGPAVRIGAIAKGSGMIAPRLDSAARPPVPSATMLAFITTDAAVRSVDLQLALEAACTVSFNRISVDNHSSCSDTVICLASGADSVSPSPREGAGGGLTPRGNKIPMSPGSDGFKRFQAALTELCQDLANQVVTDGEGATRTFKVTVRGTKTPADADRIAREIVNSPLVKCAFHGRDPNWGRIVTAAGNAGVHFNPAKATLTLGQVVVYKNGMPVMEALSNPDLKTTMAAKRIDCTLTLGEGSAEGWMIGCDLSKDYVTINAEYTT